MQVQEYLNNFIATEHVAEAIAPWKMALASLESEFGITSREFITQSGPVLITLNYSQIDSPKLHPIVKECRSLVLGITEEGYFSVVSRALDRFFNIGEVDSGDNISDLTPYPKLDGSLVTLFHFEGQWLYRTKSVIMPVDKVNGLDKTWKDLIEHGLGFPECCEDLDECSSYIFELTSPYNRVVTRYEDCRMTLLAERSSFSGEYFDIGAMAYPTSWTISQPVREVLSANDAIERAKALRNLEEGFVLYNSSGVPVYKVKNPAYVAAHHLRGEGVLSPKRIADLIIINECSEYLSVFPEDTEKLLPYIQAYQCFKTACNKIFKQYSECESQKDFALVAKHYPFQAVLFKMRQGLTCEQAFDTLSESKKRDIIFKVKESIYGT